MNSYQEKISAAQTGSGADQVSTAWFAVPDGAVYCSMQISDAANASKPSTSVIDLQVSNDESPTGVKIETTLCAGGSASVTGAGMIQRAEIRAVKFVRAAVSTPDTGADRVLVTFHFSA